MLIEKVRDEVLKKFNEKFDGKEFFNEEMKNYIEKYIKNILNFRILNNDSKVERTFGENFNEFIIVMDNTGKVILNLADEDFHTILSNYEGLVLESYCCLLTETNNTVTFLLCDLKENSKINFINKNWYSDITFLENYTYFEKECDNYCTRLVTIKDEDVEKFCKEFIPILKRELENSLFTYKESIYEKTKETNNDLFIEEITDENIIRPMFASVILLFVLKRIEAAIDSGEFKEKK